MRPHYQLRVLVYHGPERVRDPDKLEQYDVVITTYNIVSSEWVEEEKEEKERDANGEIIKKKKSKDEEKERDHWPTAAQRSRAALSSPLFAIRWLRICLDEVCTNTASLSSALLLPVPSLTVRSGLLCCLSVSGSQHPRARHSAVACLPRAGR